MRNKYPLIILFVVVSLLNLHFININNEQETEESLHRLQMIYDNEQKANANLVSMKDNIKKRLELFELIENTHKYNQYQSDEAIALIETLGITYLDYTYQNATILTKSEILIAP